MKAVRRGSGWEMRETKLERQLRLSIEELKKQAWAKEIERTKHSVSVGVPAGGGRKLVARYAVSIAQVMAKPFDMPELDAALAAHSAAGREVRRYDDEQRGVMVYEVWE
jgi:hypothetical protein